MTTIRQLIQSSPARANELFAKLVDTSETAVKTREKLFAELKGELELLASLEEQHLFPVLRKHKELKELVREALNDNKATRKLLTELDHTPKDSEEFATRVAELRGVFQQHVRDEKKELLHAILKALSDEEAEAMVESFEAGKAEVEEAKRAEAEERQAEAKRDRDKADAAQARREEVQRAEAAERRAVARQEREEAERLQEAQRAEAAQRRAVARQEREEAERLQKAAEAVVNTAWAGPRTAQRAAQNTAGAVSQVAQRTTDQVTQVFGAADERVQKLTERTAETFKAAAYARTGLARGMQEATGEYLDMVQERMRANLDGVNALVSCRTLSELLQAQNSLFRSNMELTLANSRRFAELSTRFAGNATRSVAAQTERNSREVR